VEIKKKKEEKGKTRKEMMPNGEELCHTCHLRR
jgi:hypothetical protein